MDRKSIPRTRERFRLDFERFGQARKQNPSLCHGIRQLSPLLDFPGINIAFDVPYDLAHNAFGGTCTEIFKLW